MRSTMIRRPNDRMYRREPPVRLASRRDENARQRRPYVSDDMVTRSRTRVHVREAPRSPFAFPKFPKIVEDAVAAAHKANPDGNVRPLAMDNFMGSNFGWAGADPIFTEFSEGVAFFGFSYLSSLAQRAEYRVATETIAAEMTREWIEIKVASGDETKNDLKKAVEDELDNLDTQHVFRQLAEGDGFFGRAHLYLDTGATDDADELITDLGNGRNVMSQLKVGPNKNQKLIRLQPVEAMWVYPTFYESVDPLKRDWYKPVTWYVMSREIHRSRILTFIGRPVPDILKPAYAFGGLSMSQMLKPYVDNWLRTRQSVSDLIQTFSYNILHTNLDATTGTGGDQLWNRIALFNNVKNNQGTIVIDKDAEDWNNVSVPVGTLDHLQAQSQEHMAAISRIPLVKLLGIQPAGLNASSEGELNSFEDWIAGFQNILFRPAVRSIIDFIQLSKYGVIDDDITFDFKPIRQMKPIELAQLQQVKAQTRAAYNQMGAVDANEIRETLAEDEDSPFEGLDLTQPLPAPPGMPGIPGMPGMPPMGGGMGGGAPGGPGGQHAPSPGGAGQQPGATPGTTKIAGLPGPPSAPAPPNPARTPDQHPGFHDPGFDLGPDDVAEPVEVVPLQLVRRPRG